MRAAAMADGFLNTKLNEEQHMPRVTMPRRVLATFAITSVAVVAGILASATDSSARQGTALVRGNVPGEWRYWGGDAWSTRYSSLDQIDASNFNSLKVAWKWDASPFGQDEYYRTTPLYANGRIFTVATTRRIAAAIDPATGRPTAIPARSTRKATGC
jgi:quinoprotein glucose dehydrogenase